MCHCYPLEVYFVENEFGKNFERIIEAHFLVHSLLTDSCQRRASQKIGCEKLIAMDLVVKCYFAKTMTGSFGCEFLFLALSVASIMTRVMLSVICVSWNAV
jgi:hypothetical protein